MNEAGPSRPKRAKIQYRNPNALTEEEMMKALLMSDDSEEEFEDESDGWYDPNKESESSDSDIDQEGVQGKLLLLHI